MTKDEVIALAEKCDIDFERNADGSLYGMMGRCGLDDFLRFAALVAAREREECAEMCELFDASHPTALAKAIRARGNP